MMEMSTAKAGRRERRGAFERSSAERAQQRRSDDLVSAMERRKIRDKYRDLIVLTEENDGSAQLDDPDKVRSLQASGPADLASHDGVLTRLPTAGSRCPLVS